MPRVERPAFANHRPERINNIRAIRGHGLHLLFLPVAQPPGAFATDVRVFVGEVVLLVRVGHHVKEHLVREQVEAIVVRAHVQPLVPADGALADVGTLAQYELVPPGILPVSTVVA